MGLTIHYELRLPRSTTEADVDTILATLRAYARTLPFEHVSPVASVSDPSLDDRKNRWSTCLEFWAMLIAEPFDEDETPFTGDVATARGFLVNPGEGCEPAGFGFLRRSDRIGVPLEWYWQCSCKTHYASNVSGAHFVACHSSLVKVLDRALKLGVDVTVQDETDYWETRDKTRLLGHVCSADGRVGGIPRPIINVVGLEHCAEAPIVGQPPFTRLETSDWQDEEHWDDQLGDPF
jgi:hypothetical protein